VRRFLPLTLAALLALAGPAAAHGDEGSLEVLEATPADVGSAVTYVVELTYANDGDPVSGRTVTATASLGGTPSAPVAMEPGEAPGTYSATISFPSPGNWTVRFDSADPVAELEVTFRVDPPPPTTEPPPTTAAPPPTTIANAGAQLDPDDESGGNGPPGVLIGGLVVTGLLAVAGVVLLVRQRRAAA
jgi:hypothetical protein